MTREELRKAVENAEAIEFLQDGKVYGKNGKVSYLKTGAHYLGKHKKAAGITAASLAAAGVGAKIAASKRKEGQKNYSLLLTEDEMNFVMERLYSDDENKSGWGKKLAVGAGMAAATAGALYAGNKGYLGKSVQAGVKTAGNYATQGWDKAKSMASSGWNNVKNTYQQTADKLKTAAPQTPPTA